MNNSGGAQQKAGGRGVKAEEGPRRGQYSTGGHPHQSEKETSGNKSTSYCFYLISAKQGHFLTNILSLYFEKLYKK